jgi:ATP-binding cassette, subfamily C, bacterial exporter for protease/lipase
MLHAHPAAETGGKAARKSNEEEAKAVTNMRGARAIELSETVDAVCPHVRSAACFSVIAAVLVLVPAAYMLEVADQVVNQRDVPTLVLLTLLVIGVLALVELLDRTRLRRLQEAGSLLERRLGERAFTAAFDATLRGVAVGGARAIEDLRTLRDFLASPPVLALMEMPASALFLAALLSVHPLLAVVALAGATLQVAIAWLNERAMRDPLQAGSRAGNDAQRYADGVQRNAPVIAALGLHAQVRQRWDAARQECMRQQAEALRRAAVHHAVARSVQIVLASSLIGLGAWLLVRNQLAQGAGLLILASLVGARMLAPLVIVVAQWRLVLQARAAWDRLDELLATVPARKPGMPLPPPCGTLQVERVTACPPGQAKPVLKDLSFALALGEVLAVSGPSGAGKTCLARVLVGLWACDSGKVRLDHADVFAWDKAQLGPWVGYLPQEVDLLEGTLAENIARFGAPQPAKVEAAARAAGLHEFIMALPQQYETPVGSDGARLSCGQRQRVALARALYGDPVLLVLDEPDAHLDDAGEAALAAAIVAGKARGRTCVVVTQRASPLALADKLLVLRQGQMHAFGPREEVLAALAREAAAQRMPRRTVAGPGQRVATP